MSRIITETLVPGHPRRRLRLEWIDGTGDVLVVVEENERERARIVVRGVELIDAATGIVRITRAADGT